ncbi:MAG TPA: c-type cytochrome domain-containing protein [Chthonomonadaceae bacterium]|nr:c-type cytochrome domain-containing protein [Chthonomonadaceae bacterium]
MQAQCLGCHGGAHPASGYTMETRDRLIAGGRHGAAILPGKGAKSNLTLYLIGELKPKMPPGGAMDLEKIALIRRWIDEGAKVDTMNAVPAATPKAAIPAIPTPSTALQPAPITALAYAPDGKALAVGGYRVVRLLDPATGEVIRTLSGAADQVQALAYSSDGKLLAAAGGIPGKAGEVVLYDTQTGKPLRTLVGHTEVVYAVAWKPNSRELATGSLDKTACIWNADTGQCTRTLKDHADAVFGVAYSPDGKLLATGSADRSAKLFDTTIWKCVAVLTAHQDAVTHVAFNRDGTLLATAGADRQIRIWKVEIGKMENPLRQQGEGDTINACAFSPDGSLLVWGASNRVVKVFNGDGSNQMREMKDAQDWVYSIAIGNDNQTVAAGTQDGKVLFWNGREGKLLRTVTLLPTGAKIEAAK